MFPPIILFIAQYGSATSPRPMACRADRWQILVAATNAMAAFIVI